SRGGGEGKRCRVVAVHDHRRDGGRPYHADDLPPRLRHPYPHRPLPRRPVPLRRHLAGRRQHDAARRQPTLKQLSTQRPAQELKQPHETVRCEETEGADTQQSRTKRHKQPAEPPKYPETRDRRSPRHLTHREQSLESPVTVRQNTAGPPLEQNRHRPPLRTPPTGPPSALSQTWKPLDHSAAKDPPDSCQPR